MSGLYPSVRLCVNNNIWRCVIYIWRRAIWRALQLDPSQPEPSTNPSPNFHVDHHACIA